MKMKNLVVGLVASAMLIASMATTAFAATSPTTDKATTKTTTSSSSNSSSSSNKSNAAVFASNVDIEIIKIDGQDVEPYAATTKQLSDKVIADAKALGTGGILKAADVKDPKNTECSSITIRAKSSAFKEGMKITVLHLAEGATAFDKVAVDKVGAGVCEVTLKSLSPVIFTAEGVSDKTGESAPVLAILAAICLAGVVFFGTKMRFAK